VRISYTPYVADATEAVNYVWDFARDDKKLDDCIKLILSAMQDDAGKLNISDTLEKKFSLKKTVNKASIDEKLVEESPAYVHDPK